MNLMDLQLLIGHVFASIPLRFESIAPEILPKLFVTVAIADRVKFVWQGCD